MRISWVGKYAALSVPLGILLLFVTPARADLTSITGNTFAGTLNGISYTGTMTQWSPGDNLTGTSTVFNDPAYSPELPTSKTVGFYSQDGFTITFASAVTNPIIDIYSLVNTLSFGSAVTIVSNGGVTGSSQVALHLTSNGQGIVGAAANGGFDAGGTIELMGTFTSITATPLTFSNDGAEFIPEAITLDTPEPASLFLFGTLAAFFLIAFRRRTA